MLSLYRFYHARISIPFTGKVFRVFLPFFSKMFVEDSSQQNADRQRRNCNLSIFDPGREKKIKLDNWSETVLLTFFSPQRKVIQYKTNFIHTVAIQESSGKCTVAAVGFSRLPYASRLSGSFVSQPPQILLRIIYDVPCWRAWGSVSRSELYTHQIEYSSGYCTLCSGVLFYPWLSNRCIS